jgi:hypothetical protein
LSFVKLRYKIKMDEDLTSWKKLKDRRLKVARDYRLKNLKRVADKNLALHKIAKKNTFTAIIFSLSTILFGAIFVFLEGNSGITKVVENAVTGVGALMGLLASFRDFVTKSTEDDCVDIKFSDVCSESVDLSLKTTDEDDIRNTEDTIERWCKWLQRMKTFYTTFTMFSSLLIIVFIILNFTSQGKNVVPINYAIIAFGGISLIIVSLIRYSLKIFTFTGDGGKDIERLLNGMKIHIKRNTALDLKNLLNYYFKFYIIKGVDPEKYEHNSKLLKNIKKFFIKLFTRSQKNKGNKKILIERLTGLVETDSKKVKEVGDVITSDIALWAWKLFTAMDRLKFILQKSTNSQSELNMKKLLKKLSLRELVGIILDSEDQKYHFSSESAKLSVDYHILRELYGASNELLNIIENEQPSKKESDEIGELSKLTKKLEVYKQIIEKNKSEECTEFTDNLIGELDGINGIKEKLKYINRWAEYLNNFTDPTSAQVDELREGIPEILNSEDLKKYDEKQKKKSFYETSKQENTNQAPKLKKITNLLLIIYEIEKELSRTPKILKEIEQKIETPIEDLRYARKVHRNSVKKLDAIENKLFKMHDNIRQDLMNKDYGDKTEKNDEKVDKTEKNDEKIDKIEISVEKIDKIEKNVEKIDNIEKKFLKAFIDKSHEIKELSENVNNKISELLIEILEKKLSSFNDKVMKEKLLKIYNNIETDNTFIEEHSKNSAPDHKISTIEKLYEKIDELKKETSQKTPIKESKKLLKRLERLLKECDPKELKLLILKKFIELKRINDYTNLHGELNNLSDFTEFEKSLNKDDNDKKLLKVLIDKSDGKFNLGKELTKTLEEFKPGTLTGVIEKQISSFNDNVKEELLKIHNNFETDKTFIEEPDHKISMIEKLYKKIDELKKETSQKTSKESKESKELLKSLEGLLKKCDSDELHKISKVLILKKFIELKGINDYTNLHEELDKLSKITEFEKLLNKDDKSHEKLNLGKELSNTIKEFETESETVKGFNDKISEVLEEPIKNKLSSFYDNKTEKDKKLIDEFSKNSDNSEISKIEKLYEKIDELKKETSQKTSKEESEKSQELLKRLEGLWDSKELQQISKVLILKKFIELRKNKDYTKLHKGLNKLNDFTEFEKLHKLFKNINQKTFESIEINHSTHLTDDKSIFKHLYYEMLDSIKEVEDDTKLKLINCYIDFGKHFGSHLFRHLIPDGKRLGSYRVANQKLIRCYYRLGELIFSDNNGENAPKKVTDLQHRKAENIYDLYNEMLLIYDDINNNEKKLLKFNDNSNDNNNDGKLPIKIIKKIKTKYAATIFALSKTDVKYLTYEIRSNPSSVDDDTKHDDDANYAKYEEA